MATIIEVGDIFEAKIFCGCNDQVGINNTRWYVSAVSATPHYEALPQAFTDFFLAAYQAYLPTQANYYGATIRRLQPTVSAIFIPTSGPQAGLVDEQPLPLQVSGLLTLRSGLGGRENRGRIYPPFLPASFSDVAGNMNDTGFGAMQTLATVYGPPYAATGLGTGNATCLLQVTNADASRFIDVSTVTYRPRFATQRRRGQTGKANFLPPF